MAKKALEIEISGKSVKFIQAVKKAQAATRSMHSEMSSVDKLMKNDPLNATLMKQKGQILNEQLIGTKKHLADLRANQEKVKAAFERGDIGADEYRKFQREIIATEQKIAQLEKAQARYVASQTRIGQLGAKYTLLGQKIEAVGQKMKAVSIAAGVVAAALGGVAYKAARQADDLNTLSKQYGISTKDLQMYKSAAELVDVPVETLAKSHSKLKKNMLAASQSASGSAAKAFNALGISVTDSSGHLRNGNAVYDEAIMKLGKMKNATERDAYAMAIFGKSAADLNPLILDGGETYRKVSEIFRKNKLEPISQSALDRANAFNDQIDIIKMVAARAIQIIGTKMAGYLLPAITAVQEKFSSLAGKIAGLSGGALSAILGIAGGLAIFAPATIFVGKFAQAFGSSLTTISRMLPLLSRVWGLLAANPIILVVAGILALVAIFGKLGASAENVGAKVAAFATGLANKISSVATMISAHGPEIAQAGIQVLTAVINGIVQAAPALLSAIGQMALAIGQTLVASAPAIVASLGSIVSNIGSMIRAHAPSIFQEGAEMLKNLVQGFANALPSIVGHIANAITGIANFVKQNWPTIIQTGTELLINLGQGIVQAIPSVVAHIPQVLAAIVSAIVALAGALLSAGAHIIAALARGIASGFGHVISTVASKAARIPSAIKRGVGSLLGIGAHLIEGLKQGMMNKFNHLISWIGNKASAIKKKITSVLDIHSPSRFTIWVGEMMNAGLMQGGERTFSKVLNSYGANMDALKERMTVGSFDTGTIAASPMGTGNQTVVTQVIHFHEPVQSPIDTERALKRQAVIMGLAGR